MTQRPEPVPAFRLPAVIAASLWAVLLAGCGGPKTIVLDNRPTWVMEAEQRLQGEPTWSVDQGGDPAPARRPVWGSQPVAQSAPSSTSRSASTGSAAPPPPVRAQPPGVSWGETKITVQVED